MSKDDAPDRIWLKAYNGSYTHPSTTWSETSCGDDCDGDIEYVRVTPSDAAVRAAAEEIRLALGRDINLGNDAEVLAAIIRRNLAASHTGEEKP